MPTDKPQPNYMPWLIVAVLGYLLWKDKAPAPPVPPPQVTVETIAHNTVVRELESRAAVFEQAASKIESKELVSDRSLLEFIKSENEKGLKDARKEFDSKTEELVPEDLSGPGGASAAGFLRASAKSWRAAASKLK